MSTSAVTLRFVPANDAHNGRFLVTPTGQAAYYYGRAQRPQDEMNPIFELVRLTDGVHHLADYMPFTVGFDGLLRKYRDCLHTFRGWGLCVLYSRHCHAGELDADCRRCRFQPFANDNREYKFLLHSNDRVDVSLHLSYVSYFTDILRRSSFKQTASGMDPFLPASSLCSGSVTSLTPPLIADDLPSLSHPSS